LIFTICSFY
jgi:hypothetical protein